MEHLHGLTAAVIGGDFRQVIVAEALVPFFKRVGIFGHPPETVADTVDKCADLSILLEQADVLVFPITGMDGTGNVRRYPSEPLLDIGGQLESLKPGTYIVTGSFTDKWLKRASDLKLRVLTYAENDWIAILNSIPTAEGAVQLAMENLSVTIHGSKVVVIGLGRVGLTVARIFRALEARVVVAARKQAALARAREMGCGAVLCQKLADVITDADLIINTAPTLILDETLLARTPSTSFIIDLASAPGGTDFEAAKKLNRKAMLAPGLPGKVAPQTAGRILAGTLPQLIAEFVAGGGEGNA